jgi:hypothetical protein
MKVVYKYRTGEPIPNSAIYLCTKVETKTNVEKSSSVKWKTKEIIKENEFVWHYFLVDIPNDK